MSDTQDVSYQITRLDRCRRGAIVAVADVAVTINDVDMLVAGWTVSRRGTEMSIDSPRYRDPVSGEWRPAFTMPPELADAIGREITVALGYEPRAAELLPA